ncbi:COP9 signalosome [Spinellus fusiger]|nr:COP9 signalosome [Spinellus fusiger]
MDIIVSLIREKDYSGLVDTCERIELEHAAGRTTISLHDIDAPFLLGYCLVHDLNSARFLRKRILARKDRVVLPEVEAVWKICASLWHQSYPDFYTALHDHTWSDMIQPLIYSLQEHTRERMLSLVTKAYTNINAEEATHYFGLEGNELIQVLMSKGWSYDTTSKLLTPAVHVEPTPQTPSHLNRVSNLAEMILHLEK